MSTYQVSFCMHNQVPLGVEELGISWDGPEDWELQNEPADPETLNPPY